MFGVPQSLIPPKFFAFGKENCAPTPPPPAHSAMVKKLFEIPVWSKYFIESKYESLYIQKIIAGKIYKHKVGYTVL